MNEMAFELRYLIADAGGLGRCDIDVPNHGLRRTPRNRGEYVRPIELVARLLTSRADPNHFGACAPRAARKHGSVAAHSCRTRPAPVCEPHARPIAPAPPVTSATRPSSFTGTILSIEASAT